MFQPFRLTSNTVSKYQKCFSSIQTTCKDDTDLGHQKVLDKDACMALCNLNLDCNFIFLTGLNICMMYQSCDEMQRTENIGSTFAKTNCPGNHLDMNNLKLCLFSMMIKGDKNSHLNYAYNS